MNITVTPEAKKHLLKLPLSIQKKAEKQFTFLLSNYRHPSLRTRRMGGKTFMSSLLGLMMWD